MNHINEEVKMLKEHTIDEEENFITNLPSNLFDDFKKQISLKIFHNLPFFRNISQKYLEQIALKI